MSSAKKAVSSAVSSVGKFVKEAPKNPLKSALTITGGLTGAGLGGAFVGSKAGEAGDSILGLGSEAGQGGVMLNKDPFNIAPEASVAYGQTAEQLKSALAQQQAVNQARTGSVAQLGQIAQGKGPSLADAQMKAAQDRNLAQLMAQQAAARNVSGGVAGRNLAVASTLGNRQTAQDAGQARLQEATQARQQLFQEKQAADLAAQGGIDTSYGYSVAPKTSMQDYERTKAGIDAQMSKIAAEERSANKAAQSQMFGSVLKGAGALFAASDEKLKKDIKPESAKLEKFLSALEASSYKYKEGTANSTPGKKFGIMAQDLEKSEVGQTIVKDTPEGKMVDMNAAISAVLAAQADLNKRLKGIEKKKKS